MALPPITSLYRFSHSDMDPGLVALYARESAGNIDYLKGLRKGTRYGVSPAHAVSGEGGRTCIQRSMWGIIYQGAGNIGECIVFGRITNLK
jgi:hypothetical protein